MSLQSDNIIGHETIKQQHASEILEAMYNGTFAIEVMQVTTDSIPMLEKACSVTKERKLNAKVLPRIKKEVKVKAEQLSNVATAPASVNNMEKDNSHQITYILENQKQELEYAENNSTRKQLKSMSPVLVKIPRPPNSFMIFAQEYRPLMSQHRPDLKNKVISTELGKAWKALSDDERAFYDLKAKEAAAEHKVMYPDYVYNPQEARLRKAQRDQTKKKLKAERQLQRKNAKSVSPKLMMYSPSMSPSLQQQLPILLPHHRLPHTPSLKITKYPATSAVNCRLQVPYSSITSSPINFNPGSYHMVDMHQLQSQIQDHTLNSDEYQLPHYVTSSNNLKWHPNLDLYNYSTSPAYITPHNEHHNGLLLPDGLGDDEENFMAISPHAINEYVVETSSPLHQTMDTLERSLQYDGIMQGDDNLNLEMLPFSAF
jgi:hypothetical protein